MCLIWFVLVLFCFFFAVYILHLHEIILHLPFPFFIWFISLRRIPARSIHAVANCKISTFLFHGWAVIHCIYIYMLYIYICIYTHTHTHTYIYMTSSLSIHLNIGDAYIFLVFSYSLHKYSDMTYLYLMVVLFLIFKEISILFSIVTVPI